MTLRTFLASALRTTATRIDAIEHPDPRGAASLADSAAKVRRVADGLDPRVHRCVVCDEMLSTAMTETHACPLDAMAAFVERQRGDSMRADGSACVACRGGPCDRCGWDGAS